MRVCQRTVMHLSSMKLKSAAAGCVIFEVNRQVGRGGEKNNGKMADTAFDFEGQNFSAHIAQTVRLLGTISSRFFALVSIYGSRKVYVQLTQTKYRACAHRNEKNMSPSPTMRLTDGF